MAPIEIAPGRLVLVLEAQVCLPRLGAIPEIIVYDLEVLDLVRDPLGFRIQSGLPLAGRGILHEPLSVPNEMPDVQLIVENAGSPAPVAMDGIVAP